MPVTMKDVAARAGVSPTVVSHVLNQKAAGIRVSATTAERVRQAARDLSYRTNVSARQFREQQTMMIGVLHGYRGVRPLFDAGSRYFSALMDGMVDAAFADGYSIALCPELYGTQPENAMVDGRFDGLIWYSGVTSVTDLNMILNCRVPIVLIHAEREDMDGRCPSVGCDNEQGIELAVQHLVGLGHRHFAFARESWSNCGDCVRRERAFTYSVKRRGLHLSPEDFWITDPAEDLARKLLSKDRATAVVAWSDGTAADIINASKEAGLRLPHDLSIVGFDSTSYCEELRPRLTSVSQPLVNMGRTAVNLLVQSIRGAATDPPAFRLQCGLDIRDSTIAPFNR